MQRNFYFWVLPFQISDLKRVEETVIVVIVTRIVTVRPVAKDTLESVGTLKRGIVIRRNQVESSSREMTLKST